MTAGWLDVYPAVLKPTSDSRLRCLWPFRSPSCSLWIAQLPSCRIQTALLAVSVHVALQPLLLFQVAELRVEVLLDVCRVDICMVHFLDWKQLLVQVLHILQYEVVIEVVPFGESFIDVPQVLADRNRFRRGVLLGQKGCHLRLQYRLFLSAEVLVLGDLPDDRLRCNPVELDVACFQIDRGLFVIDENFLRDVIDQGGLKFPVLALASFAADLLSPSGDGVLMLLI